jgi:tryptophan 2,3-dioxygenase
MGALVALERDEGLAAMSKRELEEGIHIDLNRGESYGDYLCLGQVLSAQKPRSARGHHDEMLFIIQHQTSELWMKLMLHELDAAVRCVNQDELEPCFKILARVAQIQRMLFEQWTVLETMTPSDYLRFRDALGPASGFQSSQYRAIEFVLGNKDANALKPHVNNAETYADLQARLARPSLYDEFLRLLARRGHAIPSDRLERDFAQPYERSDAVLGVFRRVYEHTERYWSEYDMCEKLVDIEERFQLWRFRHMTTVKRVIGFRRGTGGSSGVAFLKKALDLVFFPELWDVRTELELRQEP